MKTIKAKNQYTIPLNYTKLTHQLLFQKHEPKSGPPCKIEVVHPWPQTPQGESVARPATLLFIILSLVCKSDIQEVYGKLSDRLFEKNVREQKHSRAVESVSQILIISL